MHSVMLKPKWPGTFRRTVTRADGSTSRLEFADREPQLLDDAEFEAVRGDLGVSLVLSKMHEGEPLAKPDHEATSAAAEAHKADLARREADRLAAKGKPPVAAEAPSGPVTRSPEPPRPTAAPGSDASSATAPAAAADVSSETKTDGDGGPSPASARARTTRR